jgi:hypothetical protein
MAHLILAGHHDKLVAVDHCMACRLVWFDSLESVQLAGLGWVGLLRCLQQGGGLALPPGAAQLGCPLCAAPLKHVQNRSRYGAFAALECPRGHGHLHSHGGLLAERGLVRSLLPAERKALLARTHHMDCLNCGAPAGGDDSSCRHCASPLVVMDLPRLMHALSRSPHGDEASPTAAGLPLRWFCVACASPLHPARDAACPACRQAAIAPSLLDLTPLLDEADALLADAATQRLLDAARARQVMLERPSRPRDWRDTQFARLQRFVGDDPPPGLPAGFRRSLLYLAPLLVLLALLLF